MDINNLNSLLSSLPAAPSKRLSVGNEEFGETKDFGSLVKGAVESINDTQKSAEQEISKAVTGESQDLHKTIIALQTADLKFQLGIQVRNKLLGAYEEVMRMQV
ncbi:MAG: flagellar hook-basal body complex protein FliE [Blastocatellia bacterium]|nr:flagellar hook-basal body complex protein FliE [Blastocatellia bacterium]